ncbi:hypothetical protein [Pseudarthrobacter sp. NamB4]|uniref:hypothetical protein n=1 Tax=Pseudarthrobacter sp. NamB4 TaxID=2576837 RepID=UPI0010FF17A6|nr:hypothetical protein [Pseudarthrobacter sp. NamB4]TLM70890.1 hypothetical protein FDW81_17065 [Pseudarthrobacter sp. NamB4]
MRFSSMQPGRREVLRAGSASLAALAVGLFLAGQPATADVQATAPHLDAAGSAPGHRHLIGVL